MTPGGSAPFAPLPADLLDRVGDGYLALDRRRTIIEASDRACAWLGRGRASLLGRPLREAIPAGESLEQALARALDEGRETRVETFFKPTRRWFEARISPAGDGVAVLLTDVTERRRAARLLAAQNAILREVAAAGPLAGSLTAICRLAEAEAEGMLCSVLLLDDDGARLRHGAAPSLPPAYVQAIDGEPIGPAAGSCGTAAFRREQVIVTDIATDPLWERYRAAALACGLRACWSTPIFGGDGRCLATFAMYYREPRAPAPEHLDLIDIATQTAAIAIQHDRTLRTLRESEERLRLATEASNTAPWDWDLRSNAVHFSALWKRQLGYAEDEIGNRLEEWESRLHPEDRAATMARLRAFLDQPQRVYENEFRLRHKDGSYRWILARGALLRDAQGRPLRMIGTHLDITERKRAEEALLSLTQEVRAVSRRLAEAEEAERSAINRELHDRVGQNLSALGLLLTMIHDELPADAQRALAPRLQDAQRVLADTVRHVRDVMAELRPPALDEYGLAAALRTHAATFSARTGVALEVVEQPPGARLPRAVENALFRIAQEALNNVAKHARATRVEIGLRVEPPSAELSVTDDGVGFDSAAPPPAASWGMQTMRERAAAIGAELRLESAPGRGVRVLVRLPNTPPP